MDVPELKLLIDGPDDAPWHLALAHGAGAPMDSTFMADFAARLSGAGIRVARFEFPYMRRRRNGEGRRPPDRPSVLMETWRDVVERLRSPTARLAIGGKSMGGRIASMIADECGVDALICLGYPFHPPGRPEKPRIGHLLDLKTPALICHGTRDPFGSPKEIDGYDLPSRVEVSYLEDGDHSLEPRARSGRSRAENWQDTCERIVAFLSAV